MLSLLTKAATPKIVGLAFAACGVLVLAVGVQTWRLDNCQAAHKLTKQTLETVRGDRDRAVDVGNENAAKNVELAADLKRCVESKAADVKAAKEQAEQAIRDRQVLAKELEIERGRRNEIYETDALCDEWRRAFVCPALERVLRESRAKSRNKD